MTRRARYSGQYETQVAIDTADVYTKFVNVKPGGLLPLEADDGTPVPPAVRDDLIKNHPDFSEVNQADEKPKSEKDGD
jgi:hypothetical protein